MSDNISIMYELQFNELLENMPKDLSTHMRTKFFTEPPVDDKFLEIILNHISNGGSMTEFAKTINIKYTDTMRWLRADKQRSNRFDQACADRSEWAKERFLSELKNIGLMDVRGLYDEKGNVKPSEEWPDDIASAVVGMDVVTEFDTVDGKKEAVGYNKKIKLADKLKALELLGKNLKLFSDKIEIGGKIKLEDIVNGSHEDSD